MLPQYCFIVLLFFNSTLLTAFSPPVGARAVHSLLQRSLPRHHLIRGVHFIQQEKERCGPAALAMVFHYYNVRIPQKELSEEIYLKKLSGSLNLDMLIAARRHGFAAQASSGNLQLLKEYLSRDLPVIALVQSQPHSNRYHYLVVYGYDDEGKVLLVHSGRTPGQKIGYEEFTRDWQPAKNWMLVVEQKKDWP